MPLPRSLTASCTQLPQPSDFWSRGVLPVLPTLVDALTYARIGSSTVKLRLWVCWGLNIQRCSRVGLPEHGYSKGFVCTCSKQVQTEYASRFHGCSPVSLFFAAGPENSVSAAFVQSSSKWRQQLLPASGTLKENLLTKSKIWSANAHGTLLCCEISRRVLWIKQPNCMPDTHTN